MQKTWVQSLSQEDSLQKGMATHSSIPAWRIPWKEEPGRLQSMGSQRVGHDWVTKTLFWDYMQPKVFLWAMVCISFCKATLYHLLKLSEQQRETTKRRWKEIRNRGRKERKIRKEMLNYWEERANQSWREDTRKISRDQSLEPTAYAVPRSTAQETCWLFIYSLSALICLPF